MLPVSTTYNAYPDIRHVDIGISFRLVDTGAADNATIAANDPEPFTDYEPIKIIDNMPAARYVSLGKNLWILNGTGTIMPDETPAEIGYWGSTLSDEDCTFETNPQLTVELSAAASSVGVTLLFDDKANSWPTEITISAYNGETLIKTQAFTNSTAEFIADMPVENYTRLVFDFAATWLPFRRIRLYSLVFGILQKFNADTIVKATFTAGCSPAAESIPARELVFTFDNAAQRYNMVNPAGIYRFLQDGQQIFTSLSIGGESVDMGLYFFTRSAAKDGALTAQITANDRILSLDSEQYNGGGAGTWTLQEALTDVLGTGYTLDIPAELAAQTIYRAVPPETSKREAVRMLLQAAMCTGWIGRAGQFVVRSIEIADTAVDAYTADNMYTLDGIEISERVDMVKITVQSGYTEDEGTTYTAGSGVNVLEVSNPCVYDGQAVANWLLAVKQRQLVYKNRNRGNPALELADTVSIQNAFDIAQDANITEQKLTFDGGLEAETTALGQSWGVAANA